MNEQIEQSNQAEEEELTCPECGKGFQDLRGLTSHARHVHEINRIQLYKKIEASKDKSPLNYIGSFVAIILFILLGRRS